MKSQVKPPPAKWWQKQRYPTLLHEMVILPDDKAGAIEHHFFESDFQARVWSAADDGHYMQRMWRSQPEDTTHDHYIWHE